MLRKLSSANGTGYLVLLSKRYYGGAEMIQIFAALTIHLKICAAFLHVINPHFFAISDQSRWKTLTILWSSLRRQLWAEPCWS
jgi:hypothetical protein